MKLTRREFLALSGKSAAGAVLLSACGVPERELLIESPVDAPEDLVRGEDAWYATSWPDGTNAEGMVARVVEGRVKKIAGNPDHPVNRGRHSARYDASIQLTYHPDRVKRPRWRRTRNGAFREIGWEMAINLLRQAVSATGGVTLVTNPLTGHLGWVVSQFAERMGARTIAFDPLEQGTLHAAMGRMLGSERLPHLDIANARTVMSFGADWLGNWVSPVGMARQFGQFRGGEARGYLIHAEPRFSMTSANADLWLPVRPGYEGALALGIANYIIEENLVPRGQIDAFTARLPQGALGAYGASEAASQAGVSEDALKKAARRLAEQRPSLAFGGGSAGAHANGSFNLGAIYSLNALLGAFGEEGGVMANGEPPLMSLADSRRHGASYRDWNETELAQWRAGFNSTVVVRGVDLVHGMPNAAVVEEALERVGTVVYVGGFMDDTAQMADLVLPEATFLESWGTGVPDPGPGYPVVTFQQPLAGTSERDPTLADARGFGDILLEAIGGIGRMRTMQDVVRGAADELHGQFNGSGSVSGATDDLFMRGVLQRGGWWNMGGRYRTSYTAHNYFQFESSPEPASAPGGAGEEFHLMPFETSGILNGALSMTPWGQQVPDPISTAAWSTWAEINKTQAERMGIREGDVLYVRSEHGEIQVVAYPQPAIPEGVLGVPIGQGRRAGGRYAEGVGANVFDVLVDRTDSETGALAWASTRVRVLKRGNRVRLPKAEGDTGSVPVEPGVPVLVVAPGETAEDAEHANEEHHRREFSPGENREAEAEEEGHGVGAGGEGQGG